MLVLISFIGNNISCVNTELNWTCPGGYLKVCDATWKTVSSKICNKTQPRIPGGFDVTPHVKNKCDNKPSCDFIVNDTSFGVVCGAKCSGLNYTYECVSKSLVLPIVLIIFSTI